MCGINGVISRDRSVSFRSVIQSMNQQIHHRGPDENGEYYDEGVSMGMQRLSIIDLSSGKQPIFSDDKMLAITFNGEIYNYRSLKVQEEKEGVRFHTKSDTEVVLKLYEKYGTDCLKMLNGMFAFAIHDKRTHEVFIARDRFGEKPLYYYQDSDKFIWASELKSIVSKFPELKVMDVKAAALYFRLSYIPAPFSIYTNIFKLPAGHFLRFDVRNHEFNSEKYWDIDPTIRYKGSYTEAASQVRELLTDSIDKRMIADVPLGVFLSGGVDSSIVASVMASLTGDKIKTFSIGFTDKRYDESERAALVAKHIGAEHHSFILSPEELENIADMVVSNYDEPFADSSAIPTYMVSYKTAQEVKVALTGDGGDEIFGGYNKYLYHNYRKIYNSIPRIMRENIKQYIERSDIRDRFNSKSAAGKAIKFLSAYNSDEISGFGDVMAMGLARHLRRKLLRISPDKSEFDVKSTFPTNPYWGDASALQQFRFIDKNISLEGDMLVKVDRASMLCSLECRAPFLDHRLAELAFSFSDEFLIKGSNKKRILKDAFAQMLPQGYFQAPKSGFEIPVGEWLRQGMKKAVENELSAEKVTKAMVLNPEEVLKLKAAHFSGKMDHGRSLWIVYCFMKWFNEQKPEISLNGN